MKIDVSIDFEVSRRVKRFAARVLPAAILLLGFGSTVDAAPPSFAAGEMLSAAKLNARFGELEARAAKTESRFSTDGKYGVAGIYVKSTLPTTKGDLSGLGVAKGYGGTRTACQTTVGTQTAHLCTADEVVRSAVLGITMTSGWYATGAAYYNQAYTNDCDGFSSVNAYGVAWRIAGASPTPEWVHCASDRPLLCCDAP